MTTIKMTSWLAWIAAALLLLLVSVAVDAIDRNDDGYDPGCDSYAVGDDIPVGSLTPNQFTKICPGDNNKNNVFGEPKCGDGGSFAFFVTRPPQKKANMERVLIEFMGGGACFTKDSCEEAGDYLSFPEQLNDYIGLSCSEISQGVENGDGGGGGNNNKPISMLCAKEIGDVDFTSYTTIVVPYCTQDVHVGDATAYYYDENGGEDDMIQVSHHGAHNTMAVLRWIFRNFKKPTHIALTGCSAGGTPLPVVYDLVNQHYNNFGVRSVQINTISDSPVYLTPSWFLENGISNWNPWTIMKRVGFNYQKWSSSEEYPTQVWNHVLRRGSNRDRWGIVLHTYDEVNLYYFQWMSGVYENDNRRFLANGDDDMQAQWWSEISTSVSTVEKKHHNVKDWYIEDDAHCSFGLYYPLQEDGFEEWAAEIFQESKILGHTTPSVTLYLSSVVLGVLFTFSVFFAASKQRDIELDGGELLHDPAATTSRSSVGKWFTACLASLHGFPFTAGYALAVTIYFWGMIIKEGFAHPANNPSLGPSAIALSSYGINNPSLIIYYSQIFRLVTSGFLCSGIITYLMTILCLWFFSRRMESNIGRRYLIVNAFIMLGPNLLFALFGQGATCSTVAFVLGQLAFYIVIQHAIREATCSMYAVLIFFAVLSSVLLTFNSWFIIMTSIVIGGAIGKFLFDITEGAHSENDSANGFTEFQKAPTVYSLKKKFITPIAAAHGVLLMVLLLRFRQPNEIYLQPFYTGCDIKYTNELEDIGGNFYDIDRRLNSGDEQNGGSYCAEFCVPHLLSKFAAFGARKAVGVNVYDGLCCPEDDYYYCEQIAIKTFSVMTYALDVEIYTIYGTDNDDAVGGEEGEGG